MSFQGYYPPMSNATVDITELDTSIIEQIVLHQDQIIEEWVKKTEKTLLHEKLNFTLAEYQEEIALPIFGFFVSIIKGYNPAGDCPVMRKVIQLFFAKDLCVEDVFLNCTGMKNALTRFIYSLQMTSGYTSEKTLDILTGIVDKNLYRILSLFTDYIREKEKILEQHYRIIEEHVALSSTDTEGTITHVTNAFCELTGYTREELLGNSHRIIRHPDMPDKVFKDMWGTIRLGLEWSGKVKNLKKDGNYFIANTQIAPVRDSEGRITEYLAIRNDITDKIASNHDPLTNLYNRRKFEKELKSAIKTATVYEEPLAMIIIDIDHFKSVNDQYGHQKGDEVIQQVAKIIQRSTRNTDVSARWGGEEFAIILPQTKLDSALVTAERIRKSVETSPILDGKSVTCSCGVHEFSPGETIESFFKQADEFLYQAKQEGRNRTVSDISV